jgi:hypothetical protein
MPSRAPGLPIVAVLLMLLIAAVARAAAPAPVARPVAPAPEAGDPRGVTHFAPTRNEMPPTFKGLLRSERDAHALELAALRAQLAAAPAGSRAALQRRIEGAKLAHEARLVSLRLDRARALGLRADGDHLSARLSQLRGDLARAGVAMEGGAR